MNKVKVVSLMLLPIFFNGCASLGKSAATGAGIGAGVGATAGFLADPGPDGSKRIKNVMIGTAIGGVVGAGTGYMVGKSAESDREAARNKGKNDALTEMQNKTTSGEDRGQPKLVPPKTEARWVPDGVRGNTFVPGHFEYVIIEPARWEMGR
jgi:hypothetical protein